jgi:hypothetical protein
LGLYNGSTLLFQILLRVKEKRRIVNLNKKTSIPKIEMSRSKLNQVTMKKFFKFLGALIFASIVFSSCDEKSQDNVNSETEQSESGNEEFDTSENTPTSSDEETNDENLISFEEHNYTKKYTESEGEVDFFDRRDRENDELIKISFADGQFGTIVKRKNRWYNYTIREKTEVEYSTKEDALQAVWDKSRKLQDAGASIAKIATKSKVPLKKDGTPDKRFKENQ